MSTHVIVLPGGGSHRHAPHEGEPVAAWPRRDALLAAGFVQGYRGYVLRPGKAVIGRPAR